MIIDDQTEDRRICKSYRNSVADLGEGDGGDRPFLQEKIFDFSEQKANENEFLPPRTVLKK
jgi:hypothetical protein